jgi:outer membrane protein assembly factor BamB/HEAT repeat protein
MNARSLLAVFCLSTLTVRCSVGQEPDPELPLFEKVLKDANVALDTPALLKLFKDRTPSEEEKTRLAESVRRLGARSFQMRTRAEQDLIKAGRLALPVLKPALQDWDIEIVRRAERCIAAIELNNDMPLLTAAARLLSARRAADSVAPLLAYLPSANDEYVIESVHHALAACGIKNDGKVNRLLLQGLLETETARRLAAAFVLGQSGDRQRLALVPLLSDSEPSVRLQAAIGLVRTGNREAAMVLTRMLAEGPLSHAGQAEEVLCNIAGEKAPAVTLGNDEATRRKCRTVWENWWKNNADGIDWKQLVVESPSLGLTLICEAHLADGGRVFECGSDGKARWTIKCNNPIDAQMLPGNRVLIADCHGGKVMEMDRDGKEVWSHACNSPLSVQRLPGGNTFIASHTDLFEVTRDGNKVWSFSRMGYVYYARKQRDGYIVVASADGVLAEVDTTGKELVRLTLGGMSNWAGVEALPAGRYLVARSGANEVVEVDRAGKVLWQVQVKNPNSAVRLKNGHTLVASHDDKCVYEFDRAGKQVWKRTVEGNTFRARRR